MAAKHAHQRPFADFKSGGDIKICMGKLLNSVIILSCIQKVKFRTSKTQQNTPKITCTNTHVKMIVQTSVVVGYSFSPLCSYKLYAHINSASAWHFSQYNSASLNVVSHWLNR